jgi:hypothetical protein
MKYEKRNGFIVSGDFYHTPMLAATASQIVPLIFGGMFIIAGISAAVFSFRLRAITTAAQTWPGVRGRIIKSTIEDHTRPKTGTQYFVSIQYSYRVRDEDHLNNQISFGGTVQFRSKSDAETKRAREFPEGKEVMVYYNPENPDQSVIDRSPTRWWVGLIIATIFVVAGSFVAGQGFR